MLQWLRLRGGRSVNRRINSFHDAIHIPGYVVVPKPKHAISLFLQPPRSNIIARFVSILAMLRTVNFDQQPSRHAGKIRDVRTDWDLSAEMRPFEIKFP
jgi:hypothetical protein